VAQVGGDWYDAFLQPDGSTMLVIGDVVGHDAEAAAGMGQIRGLLRGIAATTGEGPAEVLTRLDQAMTLLQVETTATAVVARLERSEDERQRGLTRLSLLIGPAAEGPADLADVESDLLLGLGPAAARSESEVTLAVGSTVLLYTDGLVERRGQSLDEGLARLRETLVGLAGCRLDELCDRVLARMLPERPEDDAALTVVRLTS
jgi:serine phosphatase RsbU (regulator of sigma subunit)